MNYFRTLALLFGAIAVFSFATPGYAGETVPFNGSFSGQVTSVTPVSADTLLFDVALSGIATHLGRFTGEAQIFQNVVNGSYSGTFTWISASGDTVSGNFTGQLIPTATAGIFENIETITVTGGSGRFAGADGSATASGQLDQNTFSFVFPFEGVISRVGADQV